MGHAPPKSVEIYCLKCRAKTGSRDVEQVTLKNGRPAPACCLLCVRHRQIPNRLRRMNPGPPGGPPATAVSCGAPGNETSALGNVAVRHHRPRAFSGLQETESLDATFTERRHPLPVSVPESRVPSMELRSPGRSLRTAMAKAPSELPTITTSLLPLVIAVYSRLRCSIG